MRRLLEYRYGLYFALAGGLLALLAGCGGLNTTNYGHTYQTRVKHFKADGRRVTCLVLETDKGTVSVSCDWQGAK